MKLTQLTTPIALLIVTLGCTVIFIVSSLSSTSAQHPHLMARSFILWLHGLGDSGPANEPIKTLFTSPEFRITKWVFPSAPNNPVSCNYGAMMPSWFDILEIPVTADSPKDESSVLRAVQNVHKMIDKEISAGTDPKNVFLAGFSQGGALTLASSLLYPKTLGGAAVFSGWIPFNSSIVDQFTQDAKKMVHVPKAQSLIVISDIKTSRCYKNQTPILWSHGVADQTVLFEAGQAGPLFLEKAGVSCEFKAYPNLGHSISNEELQHLQAWIKTRMQSTS